MARRLAAGAEGGGRGAAGRPPGGLAGRGRRGGWGAAGVAGGCPRRRRGAAGGRRDGGALRRRGRARQQRRPRPRRAAAHGDPAAWREMVDVNVLALCLFTQAAIASMRARGDVGHVVHIGSMAGHRMPAGTSGAFYAATKHAVRALTEGLRRELHAAGSGVRVTAISPGYVETGFAAVFTGQPDAGQTVYGQYPCVQPAEVADLVAFVLTRPPHVQVHDLLVRPLGQPA
ncbi:MAG: SDR family NAD(P)-dependent oxidoreductase [bacterium]